MSDLKGRNLTGITDLNHDEIEIILEVARENGIHIPTLCYNEALAPAGTCGQLQVMHC